MYQRHARLAGAVDVYLPDLKYLDSALAASLSGAADYPQHAAAAVLEMTHQTGPMRLDADGIAQRGTLVRHLVLPGHTRASLAVLDWLAAHREAGCWVSLLFQYTPVGLGPDVPDVLRRRLTPRECRKVSDYLLSLGLTDGYVQERASADAAYIPAFDGTGLSV